MQYCKKIALYYYLVALKIAEMFGELLSEERMAGTTHDFLLLLNMSCMCANVTKVNAASVIYQIQGFKDFTLKVVTLRLLCCV